MSNIPALVFPDLLLLEDFKGNIQTFFKAIYSVFEYDFIKNQPRYEGLKVTVRRYPEMDDLQRTFYHITHEGEDETNR